MFLIMILIVVVTCYFIIVVQYCICKSLSRPWTSCELPDMPQCLFMNQVFVNRPKVPWISWNANQSKQKYLQNQCKLSTRCTLSQPSKHSETYRSFSAHSWKVHSRSQVQDMTRTRKGAVFSQAMTSISSLKGLLNGENCMAWIPKISSLAPFESFGCGMVTWWHLNPSNRGLPACRQGNSIFRTRWQTPARQVICEGAVHPKCEALVSSARFVSWLPVLPAVQRSTILHKGLCPHELHLQLIAVSFHISHLGLRNYPATSWANGNGTRVKWKCTQMNEHPLQSWL